MTKLQCESPKADGLSNNTEGRVSMAGSGVFNGPN